MKNQDQLEVLLQKNLKAFKEVPERDPKVAAQRRAQFLGRAVSASEVHRHNKWMFISRKENFVMNLLISTLVIAGLLFGGGATVHAAQDDLPNEPLYALKIWSEETTLQLQNNSQDQAVYLMTMAQTRIQEMKQLVVNDQPIPEDLPLRLEQHIQQALQLCTNLDDTTCDQIRNRLQDQDRIIQQLLLDAPASDQAVLLRTRDMLRIHLRLMDNELLNEEMNQNMIQNQNQNGQSEDFTPPAQTETGTQFNQPTDAPGGPSAGPGEPNTDAGNQNNDPGSPNTDVGSDNFGGKNGNKP